MTTLKDAVQALNDRRESSGTPDTWDELKERDHESTMFSVRAMLIGSDLEPDEIEEMAFIYAVPKAINAIVAGMELEALIPAQWADGVAVGVLYMIMKQEEDATPGDSELQNPE